MPKYAEESVSKLLRHSLIGTTSLGISRRRGFDRCSFDDVSHPSFFSIVAEENGTIVGSNCLDERTPISGVGPITIDPGTQNRSIGPRLMQAVMTRAQQWKFASVRLVQAATTIVPSRPMSKVTTAMAN